MLYAAVPVAPATEPRRVAVPSLHTAGQPAGQAEEPPPTLPTASPAELMPDTEVAVPPDILGSACTLHVGDWAAETADAKDAPTARRIDNRRSDVARLMFINPRIVALFLPIDCSFISALPASRA
jgi:hypothetical protein